MYFQVENMERNNFLIHEQNIYKKPVLSEMISVMS